MPAAAARPANQLAAASRPQSITASAPRPTALSSSTVPLPEGDTEPLKAPPEAVFAERGRRRALVFWESGRTVFDLPDGGEITIGRGADCNVRIEHASVSRRHLTLY